MKYLSQRDPRWSFKFLGRKSKVTVGRMGCTVTSISMCSDYFGKYWSPGDIASQDWFTSDAKIIWSKISIPGMRFTGRLFRKSDAAIDAALRHPDRTVILEVDNGSHWVIAIKRNILGRIIAVDPWDGTQCDVISKYKNITGMAFFDRAS
jgi:hypothetical protein